ncbi:peptidase M29 [Acuticoccus sp. MNP-M23]|uniref:peptidase M29 n=1 Tax=Acuticoccus sp. MNP-M23 TaxID=3072793 RepID=UPI0028155396|nr:peptidase M29 [Acuticoccus sp. MNP-M23]WMS44782.1 peptidase M29 [Acuticoccus sp. MNP-M23]
MHGERIEGHHIDAFAELFEASAIRPAEQVAILTETGSRAINVAIAELALARLGVRPFRLVAPTPRMGRMIVRSTGGTQALTGLTPLVEAMKAADVVIDLTLEGLMHARETAEILKAGTRIQVISDEHPDMLSRMRLDPALKDAVRAAARRAREAAVMRVTSEAGSDLTVDMTGAQTVGVWGWTDRPGTLAHWPGGIVVAFPRAGTVAGRLVLQPGDMNLTYKRYVESAVALTLENDHVVRVDGDGVDARLMRDTWAAWGDADATAVSHVGWGLNPAARWDALTMMDRRDTNGTELRAVPGNFLFSTGANEFAGRFTEGHFDLPMMGCTIALDGVPVVGAGRLV